MGAACAALGPGLALALLLGAAALGARAAEPAAAGGEEARIGRFRVTRIGDGIEISRPRDRTLGLALAAGGGALALLGLGLVAAGTRGAGTGALVLGLGFAAVGGIAAFGSAVWRANRAELVRERIGGRVDRWPHEAIGAVELRQREASAEDFKRVTARPWDVRVRGPDGASLAGRFALESETEARALATALGGALGVPVRED
jgi:hypothetical protein